MPTVAFAVMGYHDAMPLMLESINVVKDKVDEIIAIGDDFTQDDMDKFRSLGCKPFIEPWTGHFSDYKNRLISHVTTDWVCVSDHDEIPTQEMADNIRRLVDESLDGHKYNIVGFDGINEITMLDGSVQTNRGTGKEQLHEAIQNCYHGEVHIWLNQSVHHWKGIRVPYAYRHVKTELETIERSIRNVYCGGGGDTWKERNPLWMPLRNICDRLGVKDYKDLLAHLRSEEVDKELEDWMEKAYAYPWHDNELKRFREYRNIVKKQC